MKLPRTRKAAIQAAYDYWLEARDDRAAFALAYDLGRVAGLRTALSETRGALSVPVAQMWIRVFLRHLEAVLRRKLP